MTHSTSRNRKPSVGLRTTWTVLSGRGILFAYDEVRDNGGEPPIEDVADKVCCTCAELEVGVDAIVPYVLKLGERRNSCLCGRSIGEFALRGELHDWSKIR
jgi:hypothetical protein